MLLTLHAATGALVGEYSPSPLFALLFGFLSHFPLDIFPHGDRRLGQLAKSGHRKPFYWFVLADMIGGTVVLATAFVLGRFEHPGLALLGLVGGLLPDVIVGVSEYFQEVRHSARMVFEPFYRFHAYIHNQAITSFDITLKTGVAVQVVLLAILWKLW